MKEALTTPASVTCITTVVSNTNTPQKLYQSKEFLGQFFHWVQRMVLTGSFNKNDRLILTTDFGVFNRSLQNILMTCNLPGKCVVDYPDVGCYLDASVWFDKYRLQLLDEDKIQAIQSEGNVDVSQVIHKFGLFPSVTVAATKAAPTTTSTTTVAPTVVAVTTQKATTKKQHLQSAPPS
ncbi:MAG: hypothetical protein H7240_09915 [Glaciimonas sp.]|nr:hypothetical protein [Glaciimonas sp.]